METFKPKFGRLDPGIGSWSRGKFEFKQGGWVYVIVQLKLGRNPKIMENPYIKLPFNEIKESPMWTTHIIMGRSNWPESKMHFAKGEINNGKAFLEITQDDPFMWEEGATIKLATIYRYEGADS